MLNHINIIMDIIIKINMNTNTNMNNRLIFYSEETNERETRNSCWLALIVVLVIIIFILVFTMI
jgi:hypothetical protein